jgi:hypothetical protein
MIFAFFCSLLDGIVHKFPNIFVNDGYTVSRHFEKCYSYWGVTDYHLRVVLRRPIGLQEML